MELYQWQKACLEAWEKNHYRGIVDVITGGGKTVLALAAVDLLRERYPDLKVRIVVPTIPLASQWKQALLQRAACEEDLPGFYGGTKKDSSDCRFMVYIVNSARTALSRHMRTSLALGEHVLLICDECHHYQSRENRRIFDFLTEQIAKSGLYCSLGLSATPFPSEQDAVYLQHVLGSEIYRYGFDRAVADGVISPFTVCQVGASFSGEERDAYEELSQEIHLLLRKVYRQYPELKNLPEKLFIQRLSKIADEADNAPENPAAAFLMLCAQRREISLLASERFCCCLELIRRLSPEDRILVFCERIDQAEYTVRAIRQEYGYSSCGIYHSGMSKASRERNMALFRDGQQHILVSCRCLDEGIDVPDANIGIVMSGSSVERQRVQRLGRIIRRASGKDAACLYYIYIRESVDNRAYLPGLPNSRSFDMRYYNREQSFSNDLYEYAAAGLVRSAGKSGMGRNAIAELWRCISEGLTRADYLLDPVSQENNIQTAKSRPEKNYWTTMKRLGTYFISSEGEN